MALSFIPLISLGYQKMSKSNFYTIIFIIISVFCGLYCANLCLEFLLNSILDQNFLSDSSHYWLLSRSLGIASYILLSVSTFFGLLLSTRAAKEFNITPKIMGLHDFLANLGLILASIHAIILLGDQYINLEIMQILFPFAIEHQNKLAFGFGQIAFYLFLAIIISYTFKSHLGMTYWRYLHPMAFLAYLFITLHGIFAGSDSQLMGMIILYAIINGSILFLTLYRMTELIKNKIAISQ